MAHVRWFLFTMAEGLWVDGLNGSANEAGGRHDRDESCVGEQKALVNSVD